MISIIMKKILPLLLLTASLAGAGCQKDQRPVDASMGQKPGIVPVEVASQAKDEIVNKGPLSVPCLQFKNHEGFLKWQAAYQQGKEQLALDMAKKIDLPAIADESLWSKVKDTFPQGASLSFCLMHKGLDNYTWAVQKDGNSKIFVYHKGDVSDLDIPVDPGGENIFFCLPRDINTSELTWTCKLDQSKNSKKVYVNRKTGEMKAFRCDEGSTSPFCK